MLFRMGNNSGSYGYNQSGLGNQNTQTGINPWRQGSTHSGNAQNATENRDKGQARGLFGGLWQRQDMSNMSTRQPRQSGYNEQYSRHNGRQNGFDGSAQQRQDQFGNHRVNMPTHDPRTAMPPNLQSNTQQAYMQQGTRPQHGMPQGIPQQRIPQQGIQQGMPQHGIQQGIPQQGIQQGMPQQGIPQHGMPQGMPQQGAVPQGNHQGVPPFSQLSQSGNVMDAAGNDQLATLNRGLPDGVRYQPLDMKSVMGQLPLPQTNNSSQVGVLPSTQQEDRSTDTNALPEFTPIVNPYGYMEKFIQNERNGAMYYKYLASISPTAEIRSMINEIEDGCIRRRDALMAIYIEKMSKPFIPAETEINNRISFRDGIWLAIKEESATLRELCSACENSSDARLISFLGYQMHKKTADISFLHLINSKSPLDE